MKLGLGRMRLALAVAADGSGEWVDGCEEGCGGRAMSKVARTSVGSLVCEPRDEVAQESSSVSDEVGVTLGGANGARDR